MGSGTSTAIIPLKPKDGLTPISWHAALERSACAPFIKERRMEGINATSLRRKSGQMGHPAFFAGVANTIAHSLDSLPGRPVLTQGRLARTYPAVGVSHRLGPLGLASMAIAVSFLSQLALDQSTWGFCCRWEGTPIGYKSILTSSRAALLEQGMLEEKRAEVGTFS